MTRVTIEVLYIFSAVPQFGSLRHVLLSPKTDLDKNITATG